MKASILFLSLVGAALALPATSDNKRDEDKFSEGQPISKDGKGGPLLGENERTVEMERKLTGATGGTNHELDLQNPDNLGRQSTDSGVVPNLKWSFSDSKTRILKGGWVREQVITDLPQSHDIAGAQQHLTKGAIRELHWHKVVSRVLDYIVLRKLTHSPGGMGLCLCRQSSRLGSGRGRKIPSGGARLRRYLVFSQGCCPHCSRP